MSLAVVVNLVVMALIFSTGVEHDAQYQLLEAEPHARHCNADIIKQLVGTISPDELQG